MYGVHCDVCKDIDGVETPAVGSCNDCTDNLCESCFTNHKRTRMTKNHTLEYKPSQSKPVTLSTYVIMRKRYAKNTNKLYHFSVNCTTSSVAQFA